MNRRIDLSDVCDSPPHLYHLPATGIAMELQMPGWRRTTGSDVLTAYYAFDGDYSSHWSGIDTHARMIRLLAKFPSNSGVLITLAQLDPAPLGIVGLNSSVFSELVWGPSKSPEAPSVDFFKGAIGPKAGRPLRQYFDAIKNANARLPYRRIYRLREYVVPAYHNMRIQCQLSVEAEIATVSRDAERFRWQAGRINRGWQLVEYTLAMLAAELAGDSANLCSNQPSDGRTRRSAGTRVGLIRPDGGSSALGCRGELTRWLR